MCFKSNWKVETILGNRNVSFHYKKSSNITFATDPIQKLFVKTDVHCGVFLNCRNGKTFVQFEVHSTKQQSSTYSEDDYYSIIKILTAGLAEQLRCLRQVKLETVVIYGFYVPTSNFLTKPIEKVQWKWNEKKLKFSITCCICNSKSIFERELIEIVDTQEVLFNELQNQLVGLREQALLPLTRLFIQNFGADAKQLCSGELFVIRCGNTIYKLPFFDQEKSRLLELFTK